MFSAVGRRDNEKRIRSSESLLHVLSRAGVSVRWKDNQSGCKGVCDGLGETIVDPKADAALCEDGRCFDEVLLRNVGALTQGSTGDIVVVLHMLGNHGPAYYKRYPTAFRRFQPTCDTGELRWQNCCGKTGRMYLLSFRQRLLKRMSSINVRQ